MIEYDSVFGSFLCSVHLPFRASFFAPAITSFPYFDVRIMFCDNYCCRRRRSLLLSAIEINRLARCLADEIINAAKGSSNSYAIKKKVNDFCCIAFISCLQSLISFSYRTSLSVSPRATANPLCLCICVVRKGVDWNWNSALVCAQKTCTDTTPARTRTRTRTRTRILT